MNFFDWNNPNLYIAIFLTIINSVLMCFVAYKFFQVMQLGGYSNRAYLAWLKDTKAKWVSRVAFLSFLTAVCLFVCNVLFGSYDPNKIWTYTGLVFYFIFITTFIYRVVSVPKKTPLKLTKRMWRLIVFFCFMFAIFSFLILYLSIDFTNHFRYTSIAISPILIPLILPLANFLIRPLENFIKNRYKKKSRKKLKSLPNLTIIGITGSYGKTSTKNFLKQILSEKFSVYASPNSYNTPMGLSRVILGELKPEHQIFIAEMGAIRKGDISEICDFIKPDIGILTAVGKQHLTTFKTFENIKNTKYELIESLDENGKAYFNAGSEELKELYENCPLKFKEATDYRDSSKDIYFTDIIANSDGLKFKLHIDKDVLDCQTQLMGEHNLENIILAVKVAHDLGVTAKKIQKAISKLEPIPHRLELSKADNGVTILDDSFNANISGAKIALKTLNYFTEKRKIIVTPGLVELGEMEREANEEFGKEIANVCDICVIVNKNNAESIKKGLLSQNFNPDNIYEVETLFLATQLFGTLLKRGDIVLLENDLPDSYI